MITKYNRYYFFSIIFIVTIFQVDAQFLDLKFEHISSENGLPQNTIHGIVKDKHGFMWFGTWGGLCRYDGYNFKVYRVDNDNPRSINNNRIHNLIKDSVEDIWVLTFDKEEVCHYNYETDDFDRVPIGEVDSRLLDSLNRWNHYATVNFTHKEFNWSIDRAANALLQKNLKTGKKKHYQPNSEDKWSLSGDYPVDIYKDNHNILWVGTYSNGLNKANLNAKPFEYYFHDSKNSQSIADNNVRALAEDNKGNLWVGTYNKGVSVIYKNGTYKHYYLNDKDPNNFTYDQVKSIYCDSRGWVWIGSKKGLAVLNPETDFLRKFTELEKDYISVYGITEDSQGNMWFASFYRGIFKYNARLDKLIHYRLKDVLKTANSNVIMEDRKKRIWLGTEGGGIAIFKKGEVQDSIFLERQYIKTQKASETALSIGDNIINHFYEDKEGFIWIATNNGLDRYDPETDEFLHLKKYPGLENLIVSGITEDGNGYLWITHKKGLTRLNKKTFQNRNFTYKDGLQSNEFSVGAIWKSKFEEKIYLGGSSGVNTFNPDSILSERTLPKTVLTNLEVLNQKVKVNTLVNGRVILSKPLYLTENIVLNYNDKGFALEFAGLHYSNPMANRYAYKLEGYDDDWIYTDANRRIASYSNLNSGKYTFKVISSNSDGVWNKKPAELVITVKPPFWASLPAYILYVILFFGVIYIYHKYTTKYERLKSKLSYESMIHSKEKELHQSKLQFFTNLSHEIKTPLTLILAPIEKLSKLLEGNKVVGDQLSTLRLSSSRLLKLVNQLLDFRRLETGNSKLFLEKNDFILFFKRLVDSFRPLAEVKNINIKFSSSYQSFLFCFDQDKLEKVFSNIISNAIKFTYENNIIDIEVLISSDNKEVICSVVNMGKGIPSNEMKLIFKPFKQGAGNSQNGTGLGLAFSKGLVELHGGTIRVLNKIKNKKVHETSFVVELPVKDHVNLNTSEPPTKTNMPFGFMEQFENTTEELEIFNSAKSGKVFINNKTPLLLIVEDDEDLRKYLKSHFESSYNIIEAANGVKGLELAISEFPDLIISDVMMAEMDGFEFCKKVKTDMRIAHTLFILLTAKSPIESQIEGLEIGADDYVTKPFNLSLLDTRVKNLLISRNQLKENFFKEKWLTPSEEVPISSDEKLLQNFSQLIEERLSDPQLNIEAICETIGVSRSVLYRKIKRLTGLGVAKIIRDIRFKKAELLLKEKKFTVSEVAFMVGFMDADYFRRAFKSEFGIPPSVFAKNDEKE